MQNKNSESKNKRYLETKLSRAACVLMTANQFRKDPKKLGEFIEKNPTYFPNIDEYQVELIKQSVLKEKKEESKTLTRDEKLQKYHSNLFPSSENPKEIIVPRFADIDEERK